jgi:hypothetical protein
MLALPLTICLLMALKKGSAKEVKSYEIDLVQEAVLVRDTTALSSMNWESYYCRLQILKTISSLEGVDVEIDWEEYEDDYLEPIDDSCYECGGRSKLGVICEKCYEEKELDSRASGLSTTPSLQHEEEGLNRVTLEQMEKDAYYEDLREEEEALWHQEVEAALMATKALIPKFKKRKKNFEKKDLRAANGVERRAGRRIKASWLR